MRAKRVAAEEQYRLIMECRSSGLTDCQWCMEHGIKPGTFYNWVKRLRKTGCYEIPNTNGLTKPVPNRQEVVKVEIQKPSCEPFRTISEPADVFLPHTPATMELILHGAVIRISNDATPELLECAIRTMREASC